MSFYFYFDLGNKIEELSGPLILVCLILQHFLKIKHK